MAGQSRDRVGRSIRLLERTTKSRPGFSRLNHAADLLPGLETGDLVEKAAMMRNFGGQRGKSPVGGLGGGPGRTRTCDAAAMLTRCQVCEWVCNVRIIAETLLGSRGLVRWKSPCQPVAADGLRLS